MQRRHPMGKAFFTYEQQLYKLQSEKELTISDPSYALKTLELLSYYSLIGGYKDLFKHPASKKYLRGVTFEELVAFYKFDEELRTLFLKYILHVERHIKSMLSYHFCEKYGENQSAYLDINNYNLKHKNKYDIYRLVRTLNDTISLPTHYAYIKHHITTYSNVPLWVAMNALTFGQVSKMYQYSSSDIRTKISSNFDNISEKQLHQLIRIIASCRNVCAHGERLYSFHVKENIPNMPLHSKLGISIKNEHYICGTSDLFAVVVSLRYLLDHNEFKIFKQQLNRIVKNVFDDCPHLSQALLYKEMGFPQNWHSITRYKI